MSKEIIEYHLAKAVIDGIVSEKEWKLWKSTGCITKETADILLKNNGIKTQTCSGCGSDVKMDNTTHIGDQHLSPDKNYKLSLHNCEKCGSTLAVKVATTPTGEANQLRPEKRRRY